MSYFPLIKNCNYESANDLTVHHARERADRDQAGPALVAALEELEAKLEEELNENGEYVNGGNSELILTERETRVEEAYGADSYAEDEEPTGPDMVLVETMPDCWRESHRAARNFGRYPGNGAERIRMMRVVAEDIIESDPDGYAHIVES